MNPETEPQAVVTAPPKKSRKPAAAEKWNIRARHIDHDPTKPLIGIRADNFSKLLAEATSFQIFDRETVTVAFGEYLQERQVSLTGEDGRAFVDFLFGQEAYHHGLNLEDYVTQLGEAPTAAADHRDRPAVNLAKADLVAYLMKAYPELFARFGKATVEGLDFYELVLELIRNPERDAQARLQLLRELEEGAADLFAQLNLLMRAASEGRFVHSPERTEMQCRGIRIACQHLIVKAEEIRLELASHPDKPKNPARDDSAEKLIVDEAEAERQFAALFHGPAARANQLTDARDPIRLTESTPTQTTADARDGDIIGRLVIVKKTGDPRNGQIGTVRSSTGDPWQFMIEFQNGAEKLDVIYRVSDFVLIGQDEQGKATAQ